MGATAHASASHMVILSLLAFAISCVHFSLRLFNLFLPFYLPFVHLFLLIPFLISLLSSWRISVTIFSNDYDDIAGLTVLLFCPPQWPPLA